MLLYSHRASYIHSIFSRTLHYFFFFFFFFFNDTATTEIYTLSLHDALPISRADAVLALDLRERACVEVGRPDAGAFAREGERRGPAHALRGRGNERGLSCQPACHGSSP